MLFKLGTCTSNVFRAMAELLRPNMKLLLVVVLLLVHVAAVALADGGLILSVGQLLSCLPISAALCLPMCWTEQVETGKMLPPPP